MDVYDVAVPMESEPNSAKYAQFIKMIKSNEPCVYLEHAIREDPWLVQCNDEYDSEASSALNIACATQNEEIVQILLKYKANPNLLSQQHHSPLYFALLQGAPEICTLLLDYDANPLVVEKGGSSCLEEAKKLLLSSIQNKSCACANLIIQAPLIKQKLQKWYAADHDDDDHESALQFLSFFPQLSLISKSIWLNHFVFDEKWHLVLLLLHHNKSVDINFRKYFDSDTSLEIACMHQNIQLVECLLDNGADPNLFDHHNEGIILRAFDSQNLPICRLLLKRNAPHLSLHNDALQMAFASPNEEERTWALDYLVMSKEVELHQHREHLGNVDNIQHIIGANRDEIVHNLHREYLILKEWMDDNNSDGIDVEQKGLSY